MTGMGRRARIISVPILIPELTMPRPTNVLPDRHFAFVMRTKFQSALVGRQAQTMTRTLAMVKRIRNTIELQNWLAMVRKSASICAVRTYESPKSVDIASVLYQADQKQTNRDLAQRVAEYGDDVVNELPVGEDFDVVGAEGGQVSSQTVVGFADETNVYTNTAQHCKDHDDIIGADEMEHELAYVET